MKDDDLLETARLRRKLKQVHKYDEIPEERRCPECDAGPLLPEGKPNRWVCVDCGRMFDGDPPDELVEVESNLEDD